MSTFVIDAIARDFTLLDTWTVAAEGRRDDFTAFLDVVSSFDPAASGSTASRALFRIRLRLGEVFGWDEPKERPIPGCAETTLYARVPMQLRGSVKVIPEAETFQRAGRFTPLYQTDAEWAAEISNDTVHAVLHFAWVKRDVDRYGARLGIYVKPRGMFGRLYLQMIRPFRHVIVYPSVLRNIERAWTKRLVAPS